MSVRKRLQFSLVSASLVALLSCAGAAPEAANASAAAVNELTAVGCGYGRGQPAIELALTAAHKNLAQQLQQSDAADFGISAQQLEAAASAAESGGLAPAETMPYLQGNETCVRYPVTTAQLTNLPAEDAFGDIVWDEDENAAVTVTGEGWANAEQGLSARQAAEYDALSRAVQMVAGVVIEDNFTARMRDNVPERALRSRRLRTSGVVEEFSYLQEQNLPDDGMKVTLLVQVQAKPLLNELEQLFSMLGDPLVYIEPMGDDFSAVERHLQEAMNALGLRVTPDPNSALLHLLADAELRDVSAGQQLALHVAIADNQQRQLTAWRNQPHLMTLPAAAANINQLSELHFMMKSQQQQLKAQIQDAAETLYEQGE